MKVGIEKKYANPITSAKVLTVMAFIGKSPPIISC